MQSVLAGMSAGMTEAFVVVSFELVKIRLQDKNSVGKFKNGTEVLKNVLKNEGKFFFIQSFIIVSLCPILNSSLRM